MKDLSKIFYETINNKEFKEIIKKYNLKVNSSNIQIKRCVISMEYNPSHIFIIYSNGYVRENIYDKRFGGSWSWNQTVLYSPEKNWDIENLTSKMMISLIKKVELKIENRNEVLRKRIIKMSKNPKLALDIIFDREVKLSSRDPLNNLYDYYLYN